MEIVLIGIPKRHCLYLFCRWCWCRVGICPSCPFAVEMSPFFSPPAPPLRCPKRGNASFRAPRTSLRRSIRWICVLSTSTISEYASLFFHVINQRPLVIARRSRSPCRGRAGDIVRRKSL